MAVKEQYEALRKAQTFDAMFKALGFKHAYDVQLSLTVQGFNHVLNASDVQYVLQWLFKTGYDVVRQSTEAPNAIPDVPASNEPRGYTNTFSDFLGH